MFLFHFGVFLFDFLLGFLELTFWNCASLFVWNTWEFCQQSIAWHQQIHEHLNTACPRCVVVVIVVVCYCYCCCLVFLFLFLISLKCFLPLFCSQVQRHFGKVFCFVFFDFVFLVHFSFFHFSLCCCCFCYCCVCYAFTLGLFCLWFFPLFFSYLFGC